MGLTQRRRDSEQNAERAQDQERKSYGGVEVLAGCAPGDEGAERTGTRLFRRVYGVGGVLEEGREGQAIFRLYDHVLDA